MSYEYSEDALFETAIQQVLEEMVVRLHIVRNLIIHGYNSVSEDIILGYRHSLFAHFRKENL